MIHSMTGFGRAERRESFGTVYVEVKSVNHRFAEVVVRLPRSWNALEDRLRRLVQGAIARGRVEVVAGRDESEPVPRAVFVDSALAQSYHDRLKEVAGILGLSESPSLELVTRMPDVVRVADALLDLDTLWPALEAAARQALEALRAMRAREGEHLAAELGGRLARLDALIAAIAARAPQVPLEYRDRLQRRVGELLARAGEPAVALDPARLAQEVALLADRADITEELARLQSHTLQFRATLEGPRDGGAAVAPGEPVGRKLDFLLQEMGREINTIGSKAGDLEISRAVIEAKAELEKIREQVQNVE